MEAIHQDLALEQPSDSVGITLRHCFVLFQVVPAGGSCTIHVSFTPLTLTDPASNHPCVGYALGFMSLDTKVRSLSAASLRK